MTNMAATDAQALLSLSSSGAPQAPNTSGAPAASTATNNPGPRKKTGGHKSKGLERSNRPSDLPLPGANTQSNNELVSLASPFFLSLDKPMTPNLVKVLQSPELLDRLRNEISSYLSEKGNKEGEAQGDGQDAPAGNPAQEAAQNFWEPMTKAINSPLGQMPTLLTPFMVPTPRVAPVSQPQQQLAQAEHPSQPQQVSQAQPQMMPMRSLAPPLIPSTEIQRIITPNPAFRDVTAFQRPHNLGATGYDVEAASRMARQQVDRYQESMRHTMSMAAMPGVSNAARGWGNEGIFLPNPYTPQEGQDARRGRLRATHRDEEGIVINKLPNGSFKCPTCGKIQARKSDHIKHQRIHTQSRPYACPVPTCGARFSDASTRSRHMKAHNPDAKIKCTYPNCNKVYSRASNMQRHLKTHIENGDGLPPNQDEPVILPVPVPPPPNNDNPPAPVPVSLQEPALPQ
eukprot:m.42557 g.42557  ORF g.42557 m.42557 type:complete len:457 (-) comp9891_c0_seq2:144-1514(-)